MRTASGFVLALFVLVGAGCAGARTAPPSTAAAGAAAGVTFSADVLPLLRGSLAPLLADEVDLRADTWEGLMAGSARGELVIPYAPDRSWLVEQARAATGEDAPTAEEIDRLRAWIAAGAPSDDGEVAYTDGPFVYVANQGDASVSVIDTEANVVARVVDLRALGFSENAKPHHIAVEADGGHWYVSLIGENRVLRFDRANRLVGQATFEVPGMLALAPGSDRLFVGRSMSAVNPPSSVGMIRLPGMETEVIDVLFPRPHALVVAPGGSTVYSASLAQNQLAAIDVDEEFVTIAEVPGGIHTFVQFALRPSDGLLVTGGQVSGQVLFFETGEDFGPPHLIDSLAVGGAPWHPVFHPDGRRVYFPTKMANGVAVVDVDRREVTARIKGEGFSQPHGSALSPDGRYLYVSNNNLSGTMDHSTMAHTPGAMEEQPGTVVVIDTATDRVVKVLTVERYPTGVGSAR